MNTAEFLRQLDSCLTSLPDEEREAAMGYYHDYFKDAGPENEQKVISELGSPEAVAQNILSEYRDIAVTSSGDQAGEQANGGRDYSSHYGNSSSGSFGKDYSGSYKSSQGGNRGDNNKILIIIILVMLSPVWVPILIGLLATVFGLAVAVFAVLAALVIVGVAIFLSGIVALVHGIIVTLGNPMTGLFEIGSGLVLIALGILITLFMSWFVMKVAPPVFRGVTNLLRKPFDRKRGT